MENDISYMETMESEFKNNNEWEQFTFHDDNDW